MESLARFEVYPSLMKSLSTGDSREAPVTLVKVLNVLQIARVADPTTVYYGPTV
jgi:hypothetical protein